MRKSSHFLSFIFLISVTIWLITTCRKEEYVIVYSKVSTVRVYNITSTSASVEGSLDSLTSAAHDEFGFCLDTVTNPTVYKQKLLASGPVELGTFEGTISNLKPSKTYHIRAFIKDNNKYIYGKDISFNTAAAVLPTVTTSSVDDITSSTAGCGGNVTSEGDKPVIAKGVCYDTIANPVIEKNRTVDGWGTGSFTSNLINMLPDKTYYARAYALSEFGVGYGSQQTFSTKSLLYSFHDEYSDNSNNWDVGDFEGGTASVTDGEYSVSYNQSGYLYLMYKSFPDFKSVTSKDFEISTSVKLSEYNPLNLLILSHLGGLIWNSDDTHFRYFIVRKSISLVKSDNSKAISYAYTVGQYDGSYTTWKDYTTFTGKDSTKLSIKKAGTKMYFFVDDIQVYSRDYSTISYDGVGFLIENATLKADYMYIDQKDYKKAAEAETTELRSLPGRNSVIRSMLLK